MPSYTMTPQQALFALIGIIVLVFGMFYWLSSIEAADDEPEYEEIRDKEADSGTSSSGGSGGDGD